MDRRETHGTVGRFKRGVLGQVGRCERGDVDDVAGALVCTDCNWKQTHAASVWQRLSSLRDEFGSARLVVCDGESFGWHQRARACGE